MSKVTISHIDEEESVKEAYKTTLCSLLKMFETSFNDSSPSDVSEDSLVVEKDLQKLLAQSVFALEMMRPTAYEMLLSSGKYRTPETGFWRLAGECCKFLRKHHERFLLSERGLRSSLQPDTHLALNRHIPLYLASESIVSTKEEGVTPPQNDVTLTSIDDVMEGVNDGANESVGKDGSEPHPRHRPIESTDLVEASKCLAGLITLTESQSFESLLTSVCFKRSQSTKRDLGLVILESILATNGLQDKTDFRNVSLAFGETPLVLAVRARDPDVVMALVRHGADVNRGWMGLESALQVLLFSPNQIFLGPQDIAAIEKCLTYLLMVMPTVHVESLVNREREGYYGLHPDWKGALRSAMVDAWGMDSIPVPSLQHFCRCTVRTSMSHLGCRIFEGLHQLPLPVQLKRYIQLVV